jgi:hypothetical protein
MTTKVKLNRQEISQLEKLVIKRVLDIVFKEHNRPSGKSKVGSGKTKYRPGGYQKDDVVEDNTGKLERSIKNNKNFIKQKKGKNDVYSLYIDLKFISYFKYLDDGRRDELNWYFGEAIFEDEKIIDKIGELTAGAIKRTIINIINEANGTND